MASLVPINNVYWPTEEVSLSSPAARKYWMTSQYKSFRCLLLHDISLSSKDERHSGTIHFDEVRVQAFTDGEYFKRRE